MKTSRRSSKERALLISVAESIGSTLGAIAAKAGAAQKALTKHGVTRKVRRESKKLVSKGKRAARTLKKAKIARKTRSILRRSAKRVSPRPARARR